MNSYIQKLSDSDNFPTDAEGRVWLSRNEKGEIVSPTDTVEVAVAPAFLFGYFIRDWGISFANEQAELAKVGKHDFGKCLIKDKSLRKEGDGRWYIDLIPENPRTQSVRMLIAKRSADGSILRDEAGNPVPHRDENGSVCTELVNKKEAFITVSPDMVLASGDEFSLPWKQGLNAFDRKRVSRQRDAERKRKQGKKERKKQTRRVLSPLDFASVLSDLD